MKNSIKKYWVLFVAIVAAVIYVVFNRKVHKSVDVDDIISEAVVKSKHTAEESLGEAAESEAEAMVLSEETMREYKEIDEMSESDFLKRLNK